MIRGTGMDLMEVGRVARSIERFGQHFLDHVFTPGEIAYCQRKRHTAAESFAARFAAKEAAAKALGTGIAAGVSWKEIEVGREPGGRPVLGLHGRAADCATKMGVQQIHLTLTHTRDLAVAVVILES